MSDVGPRTDSSVFVVVHELGVPKNCYTLMQLGRVPCVGEFIFSPADHCLKVKRVIHLVDSAVKSFSPWAHDQDRKRVGVYCAWVEVEETDEFTAMDIETTGVT